MATKNLTLPVTGMTCASCASRIERGLKKVSGVETAQVNLASEQATITYDPQQVQPHDLVAAVERSGYGVISDQIDFAVTGHDLRLVRESGREGAEEGRRRAGRQRQPGDRARDRDLCTGVADFAALQAAVEAAGYGVIAPAQTDATDTPALSEAVARAPS